MSTITTGIMDRLREGTRALHDVAEGHEFQRALFAGQLVQSGYIAYLGQMYCVYTALESALVQAAAERAEISQVVKLHNLRAGDLAADLAHFGVDADTVKPGPATAALLAEIDALRRRGPLALLGMHYVLEGSNNGNHFIARNIRKAYRLDGAGARFLDPYGDLQRPRWMEYKEALGALPLSDEESNALLAAAQAMFQAISRISAELHATPAA